MSKYSKLTIGVNPLSKKSQKNFSAPTDADIAQMERDLRDAYEQRRKQAQDAGDDIARQHWLIQRRAIDLAISSRVAWEQAQPPVVDPAPTPDPDAIRVAPGDDIAAAIARLQPGGSLLFERGGVYRGGLGEWRISGLSADQPTVVGAYGEGDPPLFMTDGEGLVSASGGTEISHVVFRDLVAVANRRDPGSADFAGGRTHEVGVAWKSASRGIRFERISLAYYSLNMVLGERREYDVYDITLDRCDLRNAYMPYDMGHSQGLFADRVQGLRIIGCVLDHNGWNENVSKAGRTGFNHNAYIYQCQGVEITGTMFSRGSNLGLKLRSDAEGMARDTTVTDCLFVDLLVGMSIGSDPIDGDRDALTHHGVTIAGNVFVGIGGVLKPGDENIQGICINVKQADDVAIADNIFAVKREPNNWYAVEITQWDRIGDVSLTGSIVYDWTANEPLVNVGGVSHSGATVADNAINLPDSTYRDPSRARDYAAIRDRVLTGEITPSEANTYIREGFTTPVNLRDLIATGDDITVEPGTYRVATLNAADSLQPVEGQTIALKAGATIVWHRPGSDDGQHCPLFFVDVPNVTIRCEPGSAVLAQGHVNTLDRSHQPHGITAGFAASVVAVGDHGHRFRCEGLHVRGLTEADDYTSAVYAVNADDGTVAGLDIESYSIGIRLTNPGIRGWTLTDIRGDNPSQAYLVHGGPCHLIYSLTADQLTIDGVWEGARCMNNHVGQRDAHGGVIVQDKSGHTIKISHASATYASGLTITGLVSHNRSGPLILGGAIDGAIVRYQFDAIEPHLIGPWSPVLKTTEPNSAGIKPRGLDVQEISDGE